jgi:hypothetical protein
MHIRALQRAHPDIGIVELTAKAHAQLCLELQYQHPLVSASSDVNEGRNDDSPESISRFREAYRHYRKGIRRKARGNDEAWKLVKEFEYWRIKRGIGWKGRLFLCGVLVKRQLRALWKWCGAQTTFLRARER